MFYRNALYNSSSGCFSLEGRGRLPDVRWIEPELSPEFQSITVTKPRQVPQRWIQGEPRPVAEVE